MPTIRHLIRRVLAAVTCLSCGVEYGPAARTQLPVSDLRRGRWVMAGKADATPRGRTVPRWPVLLIALPAFVAIWSGWVGLGRLTGFGPVVLLPGIADEWVIDSAITLPIGVESYAAYAMFVWLAPTSLQVSEAARRFACWSSMGSLVLGMAGQVAYHLMTAAYFAAAPWQITAFVACLPVVVLGCAAALVHLTHRTTDHDRTGGQDVGAEPAPLDVTPADFDPADEDEPDGLRVGEQLDDRGEQDAGPDYRDEDLPIPTRMDLAIAAELAADRAIPGRRRLAALLGITNDYPIRVELERRAAESNGHSNRQEQTS